MPITLVGPLCARRGCRRPDWKDGLCHACWRLAHLFGKDPRLFAYEPLQGYADERDAGALPWERWEAQPRSQGRSVASVPAPPGAPGPGDG